MFRLHIHIIRGSPISEIKNLCKWADKVKRVCLVIFTTGTIREMSSKFLLNIIKDD